MKITFSRQEILAALMFASQDGSRYQLTGVSVEWRKNSAPTLVATDGVRLVAIQTKSDQEHDQEPDFVSAILSAEFLKPLCLLSKGIGGKLLPWVTLELKAGSKRVKAELVGKPLYLELEDGGLVEGEYPDWRQVIPAPSKGRTPITDIALNAEYVGDFAKAAKLLGSESFVAQFNLVGKEKVVEVKLKGLPDFYGIINQCKLDEDVNYQPEFVVIKEMFPSNSSEPGDES